MNQTNIINELNVAKERKAEIKKEIDRILKLPEDSRRMRAAFKLWLSVNPRVEVSYSDGTRAWVTAKVAYKQTLEKVNYLKGLSEREDGRKNSATKYSDVGWRSLVEFPPGSMEFMRMFAMNLFTGDSQQQKKAIISIGKVFPELVIPRSGI